MVVLAGSLLVGVPYTRVSPESPASFLLYDPYLLGCALAVWWAGLRQREGRLLWYLAAAAIAVYVGGDLAWYAVLWTTGQSPASASIADIGYLAYYPLVVGCLLVLLRRRRRGALPDWATLLDSVIITIGLGLVLWIFLVLPAMAGAEGSPIGRLIALTYPLMDLVLLAVAVRLMVTAGRRPVSYHLLVGGILTMLIGDAVASWQMLAGSYVGGGWPDVALLAAQGLIAAAALHPSAADLVRPPVDRPAGSTQGRLLGMSVAASLGPVTAAVTPDASQRVLALAATGVMFVLILARLEVVNGWLRQAEARFRSLVTNATDGIVVLDRQGAVSYASPSTEELLQVAGPGRFGATVHPDDLLIVDAALDRAREAPAGATVAFTARLRHRDGGWRSIEGTASNLLADRSVAGVVINLRDVTERAELEAQLRDQALHDPVTGLANRSLFLDRAGQALARLQRSDETLAVLVVDLDDFAAVEDVLGHRLGDEVLRALGERLVGCVRPCDTVARLGGDEFAVLLAEVVSERQVTASAERIMEAIRDPVPVGLEDTAFLTASIGIALGAPGLPVGTLLRNATVAMHAAAQGRPSRLSVFDPALAAAGFPPLRLVADL
jgi:diguanylate cyclase (GGDEF)-like protein/PAS domain S-box-containing protein